MRYEIYLRYEKENKCLRLNQAGNLRDAIKIGRELKNQYSETDLGVFIVDTFAQETINI